MSGLRIPDATYRLQFNRQFRFRNAQALVPYLNRLGISELYASPLFKARPGSLHGYDIADPSCLNPELGTEDEFEELVRELKHYKMGLLLDIVPNHMAASPHNPWWADLLENGRCSPYAVSFDIDWGVLDNRVLLPILNSPYEHVLASGELVLTLEDNGLFAGYHGYQLPLDIKSCGLVISHGTNTTGAALGADSAGFQQLRQLTDALERLPAIDTLRPEEAGEQYRERQRIKEGFLRLASTSPWVKALLQKNIAIFNGKKGENDGSHLLNRLLKRQVYKLAFWKTARKQINYRRFFDINDLIGIRVEEPAVFTATHSLILQLIREGKVSGLRIDHIDGLYDPQQYLSRLQHHIAQEKAESRSSFYVVVEKILAGNETLPDEWPVFGTTGYDFLNTLNALFVDSRGLSPLKDIYYRFTGARVGFQDIVYQKKRQVIKELFPGEIQLMAERLFRLAQESADTEVIPPEELALALTEITACLPVYRTYTRNSKVSSRDEPYLKHAAQEARERNPALEDRALDCVIHVLSLQHPQDLATEQQEKWQSFVSKWQQLTGAIMAKGFEDTALYNYNPLVSLNEVGGDPASAVLSAEEFHRSNRERLKSQPHTLNATSTHDTKRSEDIRARINVLSEIPREWEQRLDRWSQWNQPRKHPVKGLPVPGPETEILLYQTLLGAWPLTAEEVPEFIERFKAYMVKAARETRVFTGWLEPNQAYEDALLKFIDNLLTTPAQDEFVRDFIPFQKIVAFYGAVDSLAQVLLKIASPGIPDFYQGTELWDFSLVDPDNRRPVDFKTRMKLLNSLIEKEAAGQELLVDEILSSWEDGRIKLYVTCKALNERKRLSDLFKDGDYLPLQVSAPKQEHVCAFVRRLGTGWALIAVPRMVSRMVGAGTFPLGRQVWGKDKLLLPEGTPQCWLNIFTGEKLTVLSGETLFLADIFSIFPLALLTNI